MATSVIVKANDQRQAMMQAQRLAAELARANERIALLEAELAALRSVDPGAEARPGAPRPNAPRAAAGGGRPPAIPFGQEIVTAHGNRVQLMPAIERGAPAAAPAPSDGAEIISPHGNKVRLIGAAAPAPAAISPRPERASIASDPDLERRGGDPAPAPSSEPSAERFALIELDIPTKGA